MPAVSEQFVSEFIVQGYSAFQSAMSGAASSMDEVETAGGRMGGAAGKAFGGVVDGLQVVGTAAIAAAGSVVGALAGIGVGIAKLAIDAAPLANIQNAFAGIAESAGVGADEMLAALQRGSAGMVSQRDLMMSFNQAAQLVGTDFAVKLPDAMQYLGKVSAATGQDMGFLLDSLVKGVGRLSPMILDNLGIQVNLTEANEAYAETIGKTASELTKEEQQAAIMNMTLQKLAENTAAMPDVTGSAAVGIEQLKTMFQDTKDQIGLAFIPVLQQLIEPLLGLAQEYIPVVVEWLSRFSEGLQALIGYFSIVISDGDAMNDWLTNLPLSIQPIVESIGNFLAVILETYTPLEFITSLIGETIAAFTGLGQETYDTVDSWYTLAAALGVPTEAIQPLIDKVYEVATAIYTVVDPIIAWLSENVKLQDILIALGIAIATVVLPVLWGIVSAVAPVIAAFLLVVAVVAALRKAWEENFLGIQEKAAAVWGFIQTFVPQVIETVRDVVTTVVAAIRQFWAENGDAIMTKAQEIWTGIQNAVQVAIETVRNVVQTIMEGLQSFWDRNGNNIMTIAQTIWQTIVTVIQTAITTVRSVVESVMNAIRSFWQSNGDTIMSYAKLVWDSIKTYIQTAIENVQLIIKAVTQAIQGDWTGFGETLREIWDNTWAAIWNALSNSITIAKDIVQRIITAVKDKFNSIDWGEVGKNIIQGIANGISAAASFIADAARNAAQAALDAAKGFLGIESPSSVMRMEVGRPTGEGLALGIADMAPLIQSEMRSLIPGLSPAGGGSTSITNTVANTYQLTTQSYVREGGLRMEFNAMAAMGRIAA